MNVHNVKTNLSGLLDRVAEGETITVSRHNKPIAELRPLPTSRPAVARTAGLLRGQIRWTEDAFKPMEDSELAEFESSPLFPPPQTKGHTNGQ